MDKYTLLQSIAVLISALLGVVVTFLPPQESRLKILFLVAFVALGASAILLQHLKAKSDKRESDEAVARSAKVQAELLLWQRGDQDNPPYVDLTTGTKPDGTFTFRFILHNSSDYPAYSIGVVIWDQDMLPKESRNYDEWVSSAIVRQRVEAMPPRSTLPLGNAVDFSQADIAKNFTIQFSSLTDNFMGGISARKTNTKGWVFATELRRVGGPKANEIVFKKIDEGYPLNSSGDVDW